MTDFEEKITDIFYDPKQGFISPLKIIQKLNITDNKLKNMIYDIINNQETYQVNKIVKKQKKFPPLQAKYPFQRVQIDLLDIGSNYNKVPTQFNKGYRYVLCCIDVFSRKAFTEPLKTKTLDEIIDSYTKIMNKMKVSPDRIDMDKESSFNSQIFKDYVKEYGTTTLNYVDDLNGVGIVERFNRTLRKMINMYMTHTGKKQWMNVLQELTDNYNNTPHSFHNLTPNEAAKDENKNEVLKVFENKTEDNIKYVKNFNIGDKVRIKIRKSSFDKKTDVNFSRDVHTIEKIEGNNYFVNDRKKAYKGDELIKVNYVYNPVQEDIEAKEESKKRKVEIELTREGINEKNVMTGRRERKPNQKYIGEQWRTS